MACQLFATVTPIVHLICDVFTIGSATYPSKHATSCSTTSTCSMTPYLSRRSVAMAFVGRNDSQTLNSADSNTIGPLEPRSTLRASKLIRIFDVKYHSYSV